MANDEVGLSDVVTLGKYEGRTLRAIIDRNPWYIRELAEVGAVCLSAAATTYLHEQVNEWMELMEVWKDGYEPPPMD